MKYFIIRHPCLVPIFANRSSSDALFRITGDYSNIKGQYNIYYKIKTKHGNYPVGDSDEEVLSLELPKIQISF